MNVLLISDIGYGKKRDLITMYKDGKPFDSVLDHYYACVTKQYTTKYD